ncbi:MAG: lysophospholipid acyltransferase family protein, partial [Candidatus Eiseniibacteriota bacterium]
PDGPRGPAEVVKPGVIYLAQRSGLPLLPVAVGARPSRRLRSWDGMRVPAPFARLHVETGMPMHVPAALDQAGEESWRVRLETELRELTGRVRAAVGEPR